eukprot:3941574-Rhodomonas_salina.6
MALAMHTSRRRLCCLTLLLLANVALSQAACGDAVTEDSEECDDGNLRSGDGCSSECVKECGWICEVAS